MPVPLGWSPTENQYFSMWYSLGTQSRIWGLGSSVWCLGFRSGVEGLGFRVWGLTLRVWFRVWGVGYGSRIWGLRLGKPCQTLVFRVYSESSGSQGRGVHKLLLVERNALLSLQC